MNFARVDEALHEAVRAKAFPGAVLRVSRDGERLYEKAVGSRSLEIPDAPVAVDTVFDLASLTKPLATTIAILMLVRDRRLDLDERVARYLPHFGVFGKSGVTIRHLLNHSSGLAAHRPYYREASGLGRLNFLASREARAWVYEQVQRERRSAAHLRADRGEEVKKCRYAHRQKPSKGRNSSQKEGRWGALGEPGRAALEGSR